MLDKKSTYQRKNLLRLQEYDYSNEEMYFITIVTENRINYFGEVVDDKVILSDSSKIIKQEWLNTGDLRSNVVLEAYVIMPNYFHALLAIKRNPVSTHCNAPVHDNRYKNSFGRLSSIVRGFKASYTRRIRKEINSSFGWHRSFYDRIVRSQKELERIENYIFENPLKFSLTK